MITHVTVVQADKLKLNQKLRLFGSSQEFCSLKCNIFTVS